jgi:hypothetical protein
MASRASYAQIRARTRVAPCVDGNRWNHAGPAWRSRRSSLAPPFVRSRASSCGFVSHVSRTCLARVSTCLSFIVRGCYPRLTNSICMCCGCEPQARPSARRTLTQKPRPNHPRSL